MVVEPGRIDGWYPAAACGHCPFLFFTTIGQSESGFCSKIGESESFFGQNRAPRPTKIVKESPYGRAGWKIIFIFGLHLRIRLWNNCGPSLFFFWDGDTQILDPKSKSKNLNLISLKTQPRQKMKQKVRTGCGGGGGGGCGGWGGGGAAPAIKSSTTENFLSEANCFFAVNLKLWNQKHYLPAAKLHKTTRVQP